MPQKLFSIRSSGAPEINLSFTDATYKEQVLGVSLGDAGHSFSVPPFNPFDPRVRDTHVGKCSEASEVG